MSAREQWEYDVLRIDNLNASLVDHLQRYGAAGWELVALHTQPPHLNLIFKRKAP